MKMNWVKKVGCLLAALTFATSFTACKGGGGLLEEAGEEIDKTKTLLRVMNFSGGLGSDWLRVLEKEFEEAHANVSYEAGKMGVDVYIDDVKATGDTMVASVATHKDDIFMTEGCNYFDFINANALKDITDIVTETIEADGKSIEDKLSTDVKNYFKVDDGKYYALPFYNAYEGINYDIDLFDDMGFYFEGDTTKANMPAKYTMAGTKKEYSFTDLSGTLSAGPNGKAGDYDDGLPATYEQFYAMCAYMKSQGVTPMLWNSYAFYMSYFMASLMADYEGRENMNLNFTFDGTAEHIVESINPDGTLNLKSVDINNANGYELYSQAGRYYALDFVNTIIQNEWVSKKPFGTGESHTTAQSDFLNGKYSDKKETIAMLVEGSWWENEADGIFKTMEGTEGASASRKNRRLGFMPFPKATDAQIGEPLTTLSINNTEIFVKRTISDDVYKVAKEFIKFVLSDKGLTTFTEYTSCYMMYDYEVSNDVLNKLSPYSRSLYNIQKVSEGVYPASHNKLWLSSSSFFSIQNNFWNSNTSVKSYSAPMTPFNEDAVTVADYFNGLRTYAEGNWERNFSKYFN